MKLSPAMDGVKAEYRSYIQAALENYDINAGKIELIRHNENITFHILAEEGPFVLRIRKPQEGFMLGVLDSGIDPFELFESEISLLRYIAKRSSRPFQEPMVTRKGQYVCDVCGYPACLLRYIDGTTLTKENVEGFAEQLGTLAADLHTAAAGFVGRRYEYSHFLVQKLKAEIILARDGSHIESGHCSVCLSALDAMDAVMTRLDAVTGVHLIHGDMGFSNLLLTEQGLTAIDFSLCGYGYRAMECGMLASNFSSGEAVERMRISYSHASGVWVSRYDTDAFLAMSVMLFIACQHTRYHKEDWFIRNMHRWTTGCLEPSNWVHDV